MIVILRNTTIKKIISWVFWLFRKKIYKNVNNSCHSKNCLLVYITNPFRTRDISLQHQNNWQAVALARVAGEFGYNVDVIDHNREVNLSKSYDLIIDLHPGLNRSYQGHMAPGCLKIAYITGSNPTFSNAAEQARLDNLYQRKGVRLRQRRYAQPFNRIEMESLDAFFFIGNSFNLETYNEFKLKRVCFIKNTGYEFLKQDDFSKKSPKNFLFFCSTGQVHKGLDLLLDVFSMRPDLNLYVCSSFKSEKDFCRLYKKELFYTKNIIPEGFVNIRSSRFREIAAACSYVIIPSSSEGLCGSALTAMSAGLIPVVSRECGFDDDQVLMLEDCRIETIRDKIDELSQRPVGWVQEQAIKSMSIIQTQYSEKQFLDSVRAAFRKLLEPSI